MSERPTDAPFGSGMPVSPAGPGRRAWVGDALVVLLLALLTLKLTYHARLAHDLPTCDDGYYAFVASRIPQDGLPAASYAPLYCVWHLGLSRLSPDPVAEYFLNRSALSFLLAAGPY